MYSFLGLVFSCPSTVQQLYIAICRNNRSMQMCSTHTRYSYRSQQRTFSQWRKKLNLRGWLLEKLAVTGGFSENVSTNMNQKKRGGWGKGGAGDLPPSPLPRINATDCGLIVMAPSTPHGIYRTDKITSHSKVSVYVTIKNIHT